MTLRIEDDWNGWDGDTIVILTDGSIWRQDEYLYEYRYAHRPRAVVSNAKMQVEGMSRAVRVRRITGAVESSIDGDWTGWSGQTVVRLIDGSVWRQAEYHYEYQYRYRPSVVIDGDEMLVEGMSKPVRVIRVG